jgi:hypothetical protein
LQSVTEWGHFGEWSTPNKKKIKVDVTACLYWHYHSVEVSLYARVRGLGLLMDYPHLYFSEITIKNKVPVLMGVFKKKTRIEKASCSSAPSPPVHLAGGRINKEGPPEVMVRHIGSFNPT